MLGVEDDLAPDTGKYHKIITVQSQQWQKETINEDDAYDLYSGRYFHFVKYF